MQSRSASHLVSTAICTRNNMFLFWFEHPTWKVASSTILSNFVEWLLWEKDISISNKTEHFSSNTPLFGFFYLFVLSFCVSPCGSNSRSCSLFHFASGTNTKETPSTKTNKICPAAKKVKRPHSVCKNVTSSWNYSYPSQNAKLDWYWPHKFSSIMIKTAKKMQKTCNPKMQLF